jgi:hypothetical protein
LLALFLFDEIACLVTTSVINLSRGRIILSRFDLKTSGDGSQTDRLTSNGLMVMNQKGTGLAGCTTFNVELA